MLDLEFSKLSNLQQVFRLKDGLLSQAQGQNFEGGDDTYRGLRNVLRTSPSVYSKLPKFIGSCTSLSEFWSFIKSQSSTYQERREFLREAFAPVIEYLEASDSNPGLQPMGEILSRFDGEGVHLTWEKALNRRIVDPEGAITAARTLIETVCKHILDDIGIAYEADVDLPKLWRLAAEQLNLAPELHHEQTFKAILGNCQSIVNNLAAIRNSVGDAHGQGRRPIRPKPKHAELAVNLAGTMAAFLVATWEERTAATSSWKS